MSILIKNMEMPKSCMNCMFCGFAGANCELDLCQITGNAQKHIPYSKMPDCPLIEVPPHRRLIDAVELEKKFCSHCDDYMSGAECEKENCFDLKIFKSMPTVIPTDKDWEDIVNAPTVIEADESDIDSFIRIFEEDDEEDGMDSFIQILKD